MARRMTDVMILLSSKHDLPVAEQCARVLYDLGIHFELHVASPHRTPAYLEDLVTHRDTKVFVGVAGGAAALPGAVAAMTSKPVIGVPVNGRVPHDSLLSIVQMPPGIPVATVGVDRGDNAGFLAAQIIGLLDPTVAAKVAAQRERAADRMLQDDRDVQNLVEA